MAGNRSWRASPGGRKLASIFRCPAMHRSRIVTVLLPPQDPHLEAAPPTQPPPAKSQRSTAESRRSWGKERCGQEQERRHHVSSLRRVADQQELMLTSRIQAWLPGPRLKSTRMVARFFPRKGKEGSNRGEIENVLAPDGSNMETHG